MRAVRAIFDGHRDHCVQVRLTAKDELELGLIALADNGHAEDWGIRVIVHLLEQGVANRAWVIAFDDRVAVDPVDNPVGIETVANGDCNVATNDGIALDRHKRGGTNFERGAV